MSFEWTDELRADVVQRYLDASPTPETTTAILNSIAEDVGASANGVRVIVMKAPGDVYIKAASSTPAAKKVDGDKPKRVSKVEAQASLTAIIEELGGTVDEAIISKLTGKAAQYFTQVFTDI